MEHIPKSEVLKHFKRFEENLDFSKNQSSAHEIFWKRGTGRC